jgi:polysaccharide export outer membrane protein
MLIKSEEFEGKCMACRRFKQNQISIMKINQLFWLVIISLLSFSVCAKEGYLLNPGDQLEISVWKEESLQREVLVLPDGTISFPLVGNVSALGKTADELRKLIIKRIKDYISDAEVTVSVISTAGNKIYVFGKVANPGVYGISGPTDILQAISLAGGLNRFADEKSIKVLRRIKGLQTSIPFDYSDVVDGENLKSNIILKSGDLIVVP